MAGFRPPTAINTPRLSNGWTPRNRRPRPRPRKPKPKRRFPPEVLTDAEVRALMAACSTTSASGIRNRALIALLYRSGLRLSEALDLYSKDVDFDRGAIRVLNGKGGKSRVSGIDPGALAILQRWIDVRANRGHDAPGCPRPLFCTSSGERVTNAYIRRLLPVLGRRAGIDKRVHAHGLRHTHAAQLREEGMDIGVISKQLGHSAISTTAHYLDHIAPFAVVNAITGRTW
jgi:site-specific recombinase XerD